MDVITYEEARLLIGARLRPVNALCFENREKFSAKALSYGFPRLDVDGVMPYD